MSFFFVCFRLELRVEGAAGP
eukprot:COSAG04_NODE_18895_length_430_cov_0.625378_1_plen_20_part_10